jgi:GxxExxY protein
MTKLVHKELSYIIVGILFKVYNELGGGYQEKYYQRAVALELKRHNISFREQVPIDLIYKENKIGKYYLDFVIENKIVLEIKVTPRFYSRDIKQILAYLKRTGLMLGILASFSKGELKFKRILKGNK